MKKNKQLTWKKKYENLERFTKLILSHFPEPILEKILKTLDKNRI
jgi:hypothetical protein